MKKLISLLLLPAIAAFFFIGCENSDNKGTLHLSITDAPVDMTEVAGLYLTITEVQYHMNDGEWYVFEGFEGPQEFNILELTNGESALLGSFELEAGTYTQLRFMLDAPVFGTPNPANPGCYILFSDESTEPLFVPSGHQTGWKAVGQFTVPSNGDVSVTADFDARKSVIKAGMTGMYILKPTIRLIVDDQAGQIVGGLSNIPEGVDIVIYAYEDGIYAAEEADDPADDQPRFPNAISSCIVDDSDSYHLAYLAPGTYDLVITTAIDGEFQEVLGIVEDIEVESKKTTSVPIDLSAL
ncbi:MAG: DUF4382 domain-containing protein [Bacteroidales bacterium]|nr:DUF4382 domain-containing protein [Bacteroidales bacterium]